ncbi:MAG: hypothetical protein HYU66_02020, partial [Armatimonadetes bacterium]|nr:hypothetical protein [Armatimonadota bacterium]
VDRILDWYDELNAVRNGFFASRGLFDQLLPASTAVGAANHAGTALCIGAWAMGIPADVGSVAEVPSPLQGSPRDYGAALSRAVELTLPGCRRLLVSGTNSIGRDGTSVRGKHAGEQAERTLDVLAALLESRRMCFAQTLRAGLYVREVSDLSEVRRVLAERGLGDLPAVAVGADICRPELRFELELDVVGGVLGGTSAM